MNVSVIYCNDSVLPLVAQLMNGVHFKASFSTEKKNPIMSQIAVNHFDSAKHFNCFGKCTDIPTSTNSSIELTI